VTDRRGGESPAGMPGNAGLKLKRTPQDEEERQWRKARRAARKAQAAAGSSKYRTSSRYDFRPSRSRSTSPDPNHPHADRHPLEDEFNAHHLPPESLQQLRAEIEEARFHSKLFNAMEDDQRLDALEASFNAYIPGRWSSPGPGPSSSSDTTADPNVMTEEQYAEWIRQGMWRRTHRAEVEAQEHREKEREAQKEKERLARKMIEKEEREREARRAAARVTKEKERRAAAWSTYRRLWDVLTAIAASMSADATTGPEDDSSMTPARPLLTFVELPWPTYPPPTRPDALTKEAVSSFLLSPNHSPEKSRKQRIRDALLAYHPDRYFGRYMMAIEPSHRTAVRDAVVKITTMLNALAEDEAPK
jgi:hypothetical protein